MENLISVPELFKKSFEIYKKKGWTLAGVMWPNLVAFLVYGVAGGIAAVIFFSSSNGGQSPSLLALLWMALVILVALAVGLLITPWTTMAALYAIKNDNASVRQSLKDGWNNLWSGGWVWFLKSLVIGLGFILLFVPGIIFSVWFAFALFAFVFEGSQGKAALARSKQITTGYWWAIFGRLVVMAVVVIAVGFFIKGIGSLVNVFIVSPFALVYTSVLYQDLKRIKGV